MATKVSTSDLVNLDNPVTAVGTINLNIRNLGTAIDNTLSRDGTSPNEMNAQIDMNSNRIVNLPAPIGDTEPARLVDVRSGISGTITVGTVTTLSPGASATVVNVGTASAAILNFGIPQGTSGTLGASGTPTIGQFGVWTNATTQKGVSITGLVKGNGASDPTAAVAGTDYCAATTGSAILKAASGSTTAATAGTDYCAATSGSSVLKGASGNTAAATAGTDFVAPATATAFTAQQYYTLSTITDAANLVWTVSTGQKAKVTLGGNRTMNAVTGAVEGATYFLWAIQDATGSRTITWTTTGAGSFDFGTAGAPTLTTTASKADLLTFEALSIGGTLKLRYTGIVRGFT